MSQFVASEAEESDDETHEDYTDAERKRLKKIRRMSDDDDEEDDEAQMAEELKDLIDDNEIEDEAGSDADSEIGGKRKKDDDDDFDDRLEDDDYDLIEENLGVKVKRNRLKRIRRIDDDDDSDQETSAKDREERERNNIANELFEGDDEEVAESMDGRRSQSSNRVRDAATAEDYAMSEDEEGEEGDYSDTDDFIVDDDGQPIARAGRRKGRHRYNDASLQEAQDIFGVDFDYDEFETFEAEGEEYEEEDEEYDEAEGEDGEERPRKKKKGRAARKKTSKKSIFEVYEPSELERGHFTDRDNEIRLADVPERFQTRLIPVSGAEEEELQDEAAWIFKQAFSKQTISQQDGAPENVKLVDLSPSKPAKKPAATDDDDWGAAPTANIEDDWGAAPSDDSAAAKPAKDPKKDPASVKIDKIREALNFMRNQNFEVPFIAFYRKEYVQPDLTIKDLWRIYHWDERWCQLQLRKKNLLKLVENMRNYQGDQIIKDMDAPLSDDMRILEEEDVERIKTAQTFEDLKDYYAHFVLYYGNDVAAMKESLRLKRNDEIREKKERKRQKKLEKELLGDEGEDKEEEPEEEDEGEDEEENNEKVKIAIRNDPYSLCRRSRFSGFAKKYGLTPAQFGECLRDNYQRHEVEQYPVEPAETAKDYTTPVFNTPELVIKAVRYMVATQLAREPLVRQCVREAYFERAKLHVRPTKKGVKEIDENHPCFPMKYIKNKPIRDLKNEQFLLLNVAENDKLLQVSLSMDTLDSYGKPIGTNTYYNEIKSLYHRDEFSTNVQEWNKERGMALHVTLNLMLYPLLQKELRTKLLLESKEFIIRECSTKLSNWLKVAPYDVDQAIKDDEDYVTSDGIRVMALAYAPDYETSAFACLVDGEGEVADFLRLPHWQKKKNSWREADKLAKLNNLDLLKKFISEKKPHVIAVGSEARDVLIHIEDIKEIIAELSEMEQMPVINVEIIDNELAKIYQTSKKGEIDFREYPPLLRQAVSIARRVQDPLFEFSQLCNQDDEILCLKFHHLQDQLSKEDMNNLILMEFVNRTNEVGVDLNQCIQHSYTANLLQFVCGLGPRKSANLIKTLKSSNARLENRTQLVTVCQMGPKVFINCAGFIKIDTNSLGDSTDAYVEVLDGSRVHPETYEWARKMAVDALEYDDMAEDANPAGALEEILENPDKLKDLDLDAFAEELERQGFGNKSITLYDIRKELNYRYNDMRIPFVAPTQEELFHLLTKETEQSFYVGKLVLARVVGFAHRKPDREQLDAANPVRNDESGLWQCPFCLTNDFLEVSDVWNHFDAGSCRGQATGIRLFLDNGIMGFIPTKFISDKHVTNPEERVKVGMNIHCRITKIDIEKFRVDLTSKSSDLADKNNEWRPSRDGYFDTDLEEKQEKAEEDAKKRAARQTYIKRVIVHPSFHNIGFREAVKLLANMDQGEVIVRPSSKGSDHLTVMWKVTDDIYQHIDVREEGKENAFSLGQSLWIMNDEFEDLDEIIARHIQPMAGFARDLLNYRYYESAEGGKRDVAATIVLEEKKKAPSRIPYFVSASKEFPGKFLLTYLPRVKPKHEFITVTSEGFRYRQQMFQSVGYLFKWFKEHFRDQIPGTPQAAAAARTPAGGATVGRTPGGQSTYIGSQTPSVNLATVDPQAIHRAAHNMPSHVYNALSQVAGRTPHRTPYDYGFGTGMPYTPSQPPMATPMMTPFNASSMTPRHQPNTSWNMPPPNLPYRTPRGGQTPRGQHGGFGESHSNQPSRGDYREDRSNSNGYRQNDKGGRGAVRGGGFDRRGGNRGGGGYDRRGGRSDNFNSFDRMRNSQPAAADDDWDTAYPAGGAVASSNKTPQRPAPAPVADAFDDWDDSYPTDNNTQSASKPSTSSASVHDWKKAAEVWAKSKSNAEEASPRRPTPARSAGDATPLFDE